MTTAQPQVVSDWAAADNSANHIELALTNAMIKDTTNGGQQQVCALRDTHNPDQVIYVTPGQIRAFSRSTSSQDSPAGRLLAAASSSR